MMHMQWAYYLQTKAVKAAIGERGLEMRNIMQLLHSL
jgi:hypothetical protein